MQKNPSEPGERISGGRTAEIFAWGNEYVIKLIRPGFPPYLADQEYHFSGAVQAMGAPAPRPVELVDIEGRRGVILQRVTGPTMATQMWRSLARVNVYARLLGELHAGLHRLRAPDFPSQRERVIYRLSESRYLSPELKHTLIRLAQSLPEDEVVCHGDFHPENVILAKEGPLVIDWESSMHGSPDGDVANTVLWIRMALTFENRLRGWLLRQLGRRIEAAYLSAYHRAAPGTLTHLEEWIALQAACHLSDGQSEKIPHLFGILRASGLGEGATSLSH